MQMFHLLLHFCLPPHILTNQLNPCTMQASLKIAKYALHYQPISNTLAEQNKLLEIQKNFQKLGRKVKPVFLSRVGNSRSRKLEDREIFDFTDSRGIKYGGRNYDVLAEIDFHHMECPIDAVTRPESPQFESHIVSKSLTLFVPSDFYTLFLSK